MRTQTRLKYLDAFDRRHSEERPGENTILSLLFVIKNRLLRKAVRNDWIATAVTTISCGTSRVPLDHNE